ncbi:MAG: HAD domain-containing protein [Jatrophihabitantaceae bacterium]
MTRPANPVWLLDIDGVVNALAHGPVRDSWPAELWVQHVVHADIPGTGRMALPILAATPVIDFITAVVDSGAVDVVWHSTWRAAAVTDLAPVLGLPSIPISVAPEWTHRPDHVWWKLPAAQRVVEAGRRLVWTDDDIAVLGDQVAELYARADTLLIAPDRCAGLNREHLQRIREFVAVPESAIGPGLPH